MSFSTFWRAGFGPALPPVVVPFPKQKTILKNLTLPSMSAAEIQNMVVLQAYRQIPLPPEKIVIRSHRVGEAAQGSSQVLMIVARKSDVLAHLKTLHESGVFPDQLVPDALAPAKEGLPNLLPEEYLAERQKRRLRKELGMSGGLLALCFLIAVGFLGQRYYTRRAYLSQLEQQGRALSLQASDLRRMQREMQLIRNQLAEKGSFLNVLGDLQAALPPRISLQSLTFDHHQHLQVQGTAFTLSDVLRFVSELQKRPLFKQAELASSSNRRLQDQDVVDFQISCPLGIPAARKKATNA